jgi:aminotransferase in exopolysaccharide biosynthesis
VKKFEEIVSFIRTTYNKPEGIIPLYEPTFIGNEKKYINECIDTTFVSSVGKFVDRFERMIEEFTGARKAVVCVNGTNALHLALKLVGVEAEDEVLMQPLTFIATTNAVSYINARPVFIDVDLDTIGLSPIKLENWLIENAEVKKDGCFNKVSKRRIKACVPMHTFGHPVKIDKIVEICNNYKIELVEDAAESIGSYYKGKHTGIFGKIGVLSFNGNKTITTGGGGMLLFNDLELGNFAKHLTTQAKVAHPWEFVHDQIGYNYRMPNINAALGCAQMEMLPLFIERKRELAIQYQSFFENLGIQFVKEPEDCKSNYWLYAIVLKNREERDAFLTYSNENGIMTRPIWRLMNKLPMFENFQCGDLTNSEWLEDRVVNITSTVNL